MKWLQNPYALARLLTGAPDLDQMFKRGGDALDKLLDEVFVSGKRPRTMFQALKVFERVAESFKEPVTFDRALREAMPDWAEQGYTIAQLERVLPSLVQVLDAPSEQEFSDADQLIVEDASFSDPVQGTVGNCYLISAMIALAWARRNELTQHLNAAGFNPPAGSFQWKFHQLNAPVPVAVIVSGRILRSGTAPLYASSSAPVEDWPSLLEKAYVAHVCGLAQGEPTRENYRSTDAMTGGTMPPVACRRLMGGTRMPARLVNDPARRIFVDGALATPHGVMEKPVMAWTNTEDNMRQPNTQNGIDLDESSIDVWKETGLWPRHAYAVLGVMKNNDVLEHVVIRNPHGAPTNSQGRLGYHQGPWMPDGVPPIPLNENGVFAISSDLFYANFGNLGWIDP